MPSQTRAIATLIRQANDFIVRHDLDEAAARCYRILALDLNNTAAQVKLKHIYADGELIEAMNYSMAGLFAPQDASPHHYRRKLAFSYRVLSRWPGWQTDIEQTPPVDDLEEVAQMIEHAYLSGEDSDLQIVWEMYVRAGAQYPATKYAIQWWMVKQYAAHGFFADAAEVLAEMLGDEADDHDARYLLAEIRWWRDQANTLAWVV